VQQHVVQLSRRGQSKATCTFPDESWPARTHDVQQHVVQLGLGLKMVGINPVPFRPDFYILPARYHIFGQIRNQYEIWDVKFENRTETVCPVSRSFPYSRIWSGYLIFTNSGYTIFFSSSPASFQPNSLGLDVPTSLPCPPHLSVSPSTCHRQPPLWLCPPRPRLWCPVVLGRCQPLLRLWVVVVTMYHHLSMYFYVLMLGSLDD